MAGMFIWNVNVLFCRVDDEKQAEILRNMTSQIKAAYRH